MSHQARANTEVEGFDSLAELALDLRWSWNHASDEVWRQLDPKLWEITHNAWVVLQTVSRDHLQRVLANPIFRKQVGDQVQTRRQETKAPAWFQQSHAQSPLTCVAYFSMEFMLSEALPIYSGGLGNVAGDQLKAASDLGVPVVGVGLLYQQGYFRQVIDKDGTQEALYPYNDPGQLPITPVRQRKPEPRAFYEAVAKTLTGAKEILMFGSGTGASSAMDHLLAELKQHHPDLAKRVIGSVIVNEQHMTEDQLLAEARAVYAGQPGAKR